MHLSCVFPKTRRDLHMVSRLLAPNAKPITFSEFKEFCYHLLLHEDYFSVAATNLVLQENPW